MSSSFKKINYSLRPGKHAARRMLCEVFGRLRRFQPVEKYVYVGFGSVWFEDFILFHRHVGVREMISIEREASARIRIESNKPFRNIRVHYNVASKVLPRLDWGRPCFVWLDYENPLSTEVLFDAGTVAVRARSGTVIAVSVPCSRAMEVEDAAKDEKGPSALERFRVALGRDCVGPKTSEADLEGWPFGALSRRIIRAEIQAKLAVRNGDAAKDETLSFRPICDIEYDDGTKMATVVGIVVAAKDADRFDDCSFGELDFLPKRGRLIRIRVPKITAREVRKLEQVLPIMPGSRMERGAIPAVEAHAFAKLYRYLPNFAVLEN